MDKINITAPYIDNLILSCQRYPDIKSELNITKLIGISNMLSKLEVQGDDEYRSIWITIERGKIEDFGDFNEYLEEGEVSNKQDFEDLWQYYYPDKVKWYNFALAKYAGVFYFYIDSKLTLQFKEDDKSEEHYDFQTELIGWLLKVTEDRIRIIQNNVEEYNAYVNTNLPFKKRTGRILRNDYWTIFPEYKQDFERSISPEMIETLKKVKVQSESKTFKYLTEICSGDFFRFCEIGYDANNYFEKSNKHLSPKDKYLSMADGRDCSLRNIDESSCAAFLNWYKTEKNCGGHPWEICRGGNSTHISLFVYPENEGWYLRLEGSSRARVIETVLMAVALFEQKVPFILGKAEEIYKMVNGTDYIGIVPETVTPRYCHSYFPDDDKIIDFMNLGTEKSTEIVKKAFWYPLPKLELAKEQNG